MKKDLKAFTIAEISVALAVIAFVVMVTIPISRKKLEKITYMQYYKAYELVSDMSKYITDYSICNNTIMDKTGMCAKVVPIDVLFGDFDRLKHSSELRAEEYLNTPVQDYDLLAVAKNYCRTLNPKDYRLADEDDLYKIITYVYYGTKAAHQNPNIPQQSFYTNTHLANIYDGIGYYYMELKSDIYPRLNSKFAAYGGSANSVGYDRGETIIIPACKATPTPDRRCFNFEYTYWGIDKINIKKTQSSYMNTSPPQSVQYFNKDKIYNADLKTDNTASITNSNTDITKKITYYRATGQAGWKDRLRKVVDQLYGSEPASVTNPKLSLGYSDYYKGNFFTGSQNSAHDSLMKPFSNTINNQDGDNEFKNPDVKTALENWMIRYGSYITTNNTYRFLDTGADTEKIIIDNKYYYPVFQISKIKGEGIYEAAIGSGCSSNCYYSTTTYNTSNDAEGDSRIITPIYELVQESLTHQPVYFYTAGDQPEGIPFGASNAYAFCRFPSLDR